MTTRAFAAVVMAVNVVSCSNVSSTSENATRTGSEPIREEIVDGPLGLVGDDETYVVSLFGDVRPDESFAIAAIYLRNEGDAALRIDEMQAIGHEGVVVLGIGFVSPITFSPGTFREFPPRGVELASADEFGPLRPVPAGIADPIGGDALLVIGLRLREGVEVGSVVGVQIRYNVDGQDYNERFAAPSVLCALPVDHARCEQGGEGTNDRWRDASAA